MNKKTISLILSIIMSLQASILPAVYADNPTNTKNDENNNSIFVDKLKDYGKYAAIGAVGITAVGATIWACINKLNISVSPEEYPDIAKEYRNYRENRKEGQKYKGRKIPFGDLKNMCNQVTSILKSEQNVPEINGPAIIVGDLHGDFEAAKFYCDEFMNSYPNKSIVFLGDYIDRGPNSIETLALLFQLKIAFPDKVHLLCGNHECMGVDNWNYKNSLITECKDKYPGKNSYGMLWNTFQNLPFAAIVKTNNGDTLCAHGGIPFSSVAIDRKRKAITLDEIKNTKRSTSIYFYDYTYSTPDVTIKEALVNGRFDKDLYTEPLTKFMKEHNLTRIVRGHDHDLAGQQQGASVIKMDNYEFITLLSSPDFIKNSFAEGYSHPGSAILIDSDNTIKISTITHSFLNKQ
ncbi:MAG: metallophosphoesterase [Clostridia bacterium]|nr:metallophosphoesterase [Clostridia bacterium]